jgi:serine protease Do
MNRVVWVVAIFFIAMAGGGIGTWLMQANMAKLPSASMFARHANDGNAMASQSEEAIATVANKVSPSVVSILTNVTGQIRAGQAAGTGIVMSKDGYIMTNKHVIENATTVSVTMSDGTTYNDVKMVGEDGLNDVAFLKVQNVNTLTPAEIGESSSLRIGQNVVAIGNSLGEYQNTVTSGIISGLGRPVSAQSEGGGSESLTDLIQTDAAINPGNSGGPLVNLKGQVVGINTAVASNAQGVGFAIPINATKGMLASVLDTGRAERSYIGVRYADVTPAVAKTKNLPVKSGALVQGGNGEPGVIAGSPADKAGLKDGDIITKINDLQVGKQGSVSSLISEHKPGTQVKVVYLRDGKEQTTNLTLEAYKKPTQQSAGSSRQVQPNLIMPFGF